MSKNAPENAPVVRDPRFASVYMDPRFARAKKPSSAAADERFAAVMQDDRFAGVLRAVRNDTKSSGKRADATGKRRRSDAEPKKDDEDDDVDGRSAGVASARSGRGSGKRVVERVEERLARLTAMSRGEYVADGSDVSSSDEETDEEAEVSRAAQYLNAPAPTLAAAPAHEAPDITPQYVPDGSETCRLALVNCDWDNLRAVDIFAALASFVPASGSIVRVCVLPSEYGQKMMEKEATLGPVALVGEHGVEVAASAATTAAVEASSSKDGKPQEFDPVLLREYELNKLKYFYAVITCDSVATATVLYTQCDGMELEATANVMDLRFIPDDVEFSQTPRDVATAVPDDYEPPEFRTAALQSSKVELTWDAEDPRRKRALDWKKLTSIGEEKELAGKRGKKRGKRANAERDGSDDEHDADLEMLHEFLASESDSDDEEAEEGAASEEAENNDDAQDATVAERRSTAGSRLSKSEMREADRSRLRALLLGEQPDVGVGSESEDEEDEEAAPAERPRKRGRDKLGKVTDDEVLQIKFTPGLGQTLSKRRREREAQQHETEFEAFLRRRKEKRKAKKAAAKLEREQRHQVGDTEEHSGVAAFSDDEDAFFAGDAAPTKQRSAKEERVERMEHVEHKGLVNKSRKELERKMKPLDAQRQAELELLMLGDTNGAAASDDSEDDAARRKAGRKRKNKDKRERDAADTTAPGREFQVDTADPRFSAMFSNPAFAIDTTAPEFRDTSAMRRVLESTTGAARPREKRAMVVVAASTVGPQGGTGGAPVERDVHQLANAVKAKFARK